MTLEQIRKLGKKRLKEVNDFLEFNLGYLSSLVNKGILKCEKKNVIFDRPKSGKLPKDIWILDCSLYAKELLSIYNKYHKKKKYIRCQRYTSDGELVDIEGDGWLYRNDAMGKYCAKSLRREMVSDKYMRNDSPVLDERRVLAKAGNKHKNFLFIYYFD